MKIRPAFLIVAAVFLGCGKASDLNPAASTTGEKVAPANPSDGSGGAASVEKPAAIDATSITVESPPEVICRAFIECLRKGEPAKAEKFLSQESINQTRKQSLDLAMPAGADATYSISAPVFATTQKKVAFVTIGIENPSAVDSTPQSFSMMLKFGNFGWKIAGMMMDSDSATQELYSFENPLDVLRIKSMLEGESRQARASEPGSEIR